MEEKISVTEQENVQTVPPRRWRMSLTVCAG